MTIPFISSWTFVLFWNSIFKSTHSFLYNLTFLKTCPSSVSTYNEIKESKNSDGNNFIVLFQIGLSYFMNKFSFRSNLNLLESVAKMLKSSKFMAQWHCNRWSDVVDSLMFFRLLLQDWRSSCVQRLWCNSGRRFFRNK